MSHEIPRPESESLSDEQQEQIRAFLQDYQINFDQLEPFAVRAIDQNIANLRDILDQLQAGEMATSKEYFQTWAGLIVGVQMMVVLQEEFEHDPQRAAELLMTTFAQLAPDELKNQR